MFLLFIILNNVVHLTLHIFNNEGERGKADFHLLFFCRLAVVPLRYVGRHLVYYFVNVNFVVIHIASSSKK